MSILDSGIFCGFYPQFVKLSVTDSKTLKANLMQECAWSKQTFSHKKLGQRRLMIPKKGNNIKINEVEIVTRNFANFGITNLYKSFAK